jgi:cytochrome d ubiquinol oxidase subunit II
MTAAEAVAALLLAAITLYAWSGLADYGAGFWDLVAGGRAGGQRARALIDTVITPVWEANHVWLVFILVVGWTGFGVAFASIMTTLFVPLCLAALGIVLRGANFALRKDAARAGGRHLAGWLFGVASVLTPFFLGAALGAVAAGRVPAVGPAAGPAGGSAGDGWTLAGGGWTSWWNPTSVLVGLLAVATGGYLSATYLVAEARRRGLPELRGYFRRRALVAGPVAFGLGIAALVSLYADQRPMFDRFTTRGAPLLVLGVVALAVALLLAARAAHRGTRMAAALGVAALVWAWGAAQYPYLLPFDLTIAQGAGAPVTQRWVLVWAAVAAVTVVPALVLLYVLDQRGELAEPDPPAPADAPPADLR